MRHLCPQWLYWLLMLAALTAPADPCHAAAGGIPGADQASELLMNEFPVLPPDARKKFDLTAQDPSAVADLGVVDFFQLVADVLKMNIVVADKSKLEARKVGIVMREMTIEEAIHLVLQMNELKAVHFNDNTIIVMDQGSKAAFGAKQARTYRLRYTTIEKVREFLNINKNLQRQLGEGISYDAANNSLVAVDTSENLQLLGLVVSQIDVPPIKLIERVKLSYLDFGQFTALAKALGKDIEARLASIGLSYNPQGRLMMAYGTPEDIKLVKKLVAKLDVAPKQVLIDTSILTIQEDSSKHFGFKLRTTGFTLNQLDRIKDIDRVRAQNDVDGIFPTQTDISYLLSKGLAKTLQSPKIRAVDGVPATINIGAIINVQIQSTATTLGTGLTPGQQQTTFNTQEVQTGTQLTVTPKIHNDQSVTLDVAISITQPTNIKSFGVDRDNQQSTTTLRLRNGETAVLGGLISGTDTANDSPIPLLGQVPILDKFFKDSSRIKTRKELVFLLTPYILDFQDGNPNVDRTDPKLSAPRTVASTAQAALSTQATGIVTAPTCIHGKPLHPECAAMLQVAAIAKSSAPEAPAEHVLGKFAPPRPIETRTIRVLETPKGTTRIEYDSRGNVLRRDFTPARTATRPSGLQAPKSGLRAAGRGLQGPDPGREIPGSAGQSALRSARAERKDGSRAGVPAGSDLAPARSTRPRSKALETIVQQHRDAPHRGKSYTAITNDTVAHFKRLETLVDPEEEGRRLRTAGYMPRDRQSRAREAQAADRVPGQVPARRANARAHAGSLPVRTPAANRPRAQLASQQTRPAARGARDSGPAVGAVDEGTEDRDAATRQAPRLPAAEPRHASPDAYLAALRQRVRRRSVQTVATDSGLGTRPSALGPRSPEIGAVGSEAMAEEENGVDSETAPASSEKDSSTGLTGRPKMTASRVQQHAALRRPAKPARPTVELATGETEPSNEDSEQTGPDEASPRAAARQVAAPSTPAKADPDAQKAELLAKLKGLARESATLMHVATLHEEPARTNGPVADGPVRAQREGSRAGVPADSDPAPAGSVRPSPARTQHLRASIQRAASGAEASEARPQTPADQRAAAGDSAPWPVRSTPSAAPGSRPRLAAAPTSTQERDRELVERLRRLAGSAAKARQETASRRVTSDDRAAAFDRRLESIRASRPVAEEAADLPGGSSFDDLARRLERDLAAGQS